MTDLLPMDPRFVWALWIACVLPLVVALLRRKRR